MAELTLRMASNLIGYTFAEVRIPVSDDITPEAAARLHWEYNLRFLQEQEKISNEPVTEEQEATVSAAATKVLTSKLPATTVETTEETPPWEKKEEPKAKKPWEEAPKFESLL